LALRPISQEMADWLRRQRRTSIIVLSTSTREQERWRGEWPKEVADAANAYIISHEGTCEHGFKAAYSTREGAYAGPQALLVAADRPVMINKRAPATNASTMNVVHMVETRSPFDILHLRGVFRLF